MFSCLGCKKVATCRLQVCVLLRSLERHPPLRQSSAAAVVTTANFVERPSKANRCPRGGTMGCGNSSEKGTKSLVGKTEQFHRIGTPQKNHKASERVPESHPARNTWQLGHSSRQVKPSSPLKSGADMNSTGNPYIYIHMYIYICMCIYI